MAHRQDQGFFSARDHLRLYWESVLPDAAPKAHVGIVHGFGEHCGRYRPFAQTLADDGFAVHAFDYRGHGQADGRRGDCHRYEEFLDDLARFWERVTTQAAGGPTFLFAHSHGALMASLWAARGPAGLRGLLLSAPYFQLAFDPPWWKTVGAKVARLIAPGLHVHNGLTSQMLTRDEAAQRRVDADPLYHHLVTPRWFAQVEQAQKQALEQASQVTVPLLMLWGGADGIALPAAMQRYFDAAGSSDKKSLVYPDMRHETLNELGREQVMKDISRWISDHL